MRRSSGLFMLAVLAAAFGAGATAAGAAQTEADRARELDERVIELEAGRAYLGVGLEEETDNPEGGARVVSVADESPAAEAGLRKGDVVIRFDGETIRGPAALSKRIRAKKPGDRATLVVLRDGKKVELEAEIGERSRISAWKIAPEALGGLAWIDEGAAEARAEEMRDLAEHLKDLKLQQLDHLHELERLEAPNLLWGCEGEDCERFVFGGGRARLGVQLVDSTPELREHLGGSGDAGVLVSKVLTGTPAESAGLRVGDLIVAVGGETIGDVGDLRRALRDRAGTTFPVDVVRDGARTTVQVTLPEESDEPASGPRALFLKPRMPAPAPPAPSAPPAPPAPAPRPVRARLV